MGKITGFKEFERQDETYIPVEERIKNYKEFTVALSDNEVKKQGSRCMDCGIPFCHSGCPLGNLIPDFNHMVHQGEWQKASWILHSTNNFPEFTGRLCPAPCEKSCVLGLIEDPVSIENIEKNIVEIAFKEGWIKPQPPKTRTGKTIAVIGSGPAGLAAAQQLNRAGHLVTVFEREDEVGGLLRYGIPNFKMEKEIIDRRIAILKAEGIEIKTNINVGVNYPVKELKSFDAIVLCGGATEKRSLPTPGIDADGVVQAMDFLTQQTKVLFGKKIENQIMATGKNVIVIGGGDTGSDCIGTSNRHGAKSVVNFEIMPKPPGHRSPATPWPFWPLQLKTSSSHEEGVERNWLINTKEFIKDENNKLIALKTVNVEWKMTPGERPQLIEIEGTEKIWPCDLALLALGFTGPESTLADRLGIEKDVRSNYKADYGKYQTNVPNIFTAGDMRRGQSLIVWAISEGREAARQVDMFLMGKSELPSKDIAGDLVAM
ncbi:MAG: glutamate synthase subunit beta [Flavobacteriia bacterium]|nr:glutamate synthase subunit beta [Flavobacteriia bacterium]OIP47558.1 MAG: glutamate synthase [Flavobacteriaceae bacterium CG2_30_31_66]PIV97985.1 MAG: glutamate synthase [Flavobacteriaceae bacterium CG17_big_fil_post_rev_8_21_14_2_50_31_13]PIX13169.1 MAG: glutamate synthase [Flavobacteriaceae bacterium CG_4_8_14_3_um_filter_31_8]PIY15822.1 MAG: glutamate synthase [Flavobacteriaceae bacterium CG_4_10_14_3_um_filter_31_253]PIZ09813.1 MAG: glutamate synthase [Flavobacteriaceae bacterium CG_4_1